MIIKTSPWTPERFLRSNHPEYVAIRHIVLQNPEHDFILVGQGVNYEHFRYGKVIFYNLGSGNKIKWILSFLLIFWLPIWFKPSVVIGLGGPPNLTPMRLASVVIRARFIPVFIGDLRFSSSALPKFFESLIYILLGAYFQSSYSILAISNLIRTELTIFCKIPSEKIQVYRYKISDIFNPLVPKNLRKELNSSGPIVLTVARMSKEKGLEYLVEASKEVIEKIPSAKFVIHAYSSIPKYRAKILELISSQRLEKNFKIIEGFSSYEEMPKIMVCADVFVLPSLSEGLPVTILEAMACGVPVVATRVCGIPDIVVDKKNGLLVEPMDSRGLANAITRLLIDQNERLVLSKGALVTTQRSIENEFENLLSKLVFAK